MKDKAKDETLTKEMFQTLIKELYRWETNQGMVAQGFVLEGPPSESKIIFSSDLTLLTPFEVELQVPEWTEELRISGTIKLGGELVGEEGTRWPCVWMRVDDGKPWDESSAVVDFTVTDYGAAYWLRSRKSGNWSARASELYEYLDADGFWFELTIRPGEISIRPGPPALATGLAAPFAAKMPLQIGHKEKKIGGKSDGKGDEPFPDGTEVLDLVVTAYREART